MKFDLKKKLVAKSGRVKSIDFHPTYPWILIGLYSGAINIYDYNTQQSLQYLEVCPQPIRSAKFIANKNQFICGSDDKKIRVYNYNTMERIKEFEAHSDFLRCIVVHPKDPFIITCSDDNTIMLWDMDKGFTLVRSFEEHKGFVMKIAINPKDPNMFASASMDKKVKIWSILSTNSHITLDGHTKGVNTVAFCPLLDKPYLASGADDFKIKIWDYTNRNCVVTLDGHDDNISSLAFHNELPILISGSEDKSCKFFNINTFKLEDTKIFGFDTIWDIAIQGENSMLGFGGEEGTLVAKIGSDQALAIFNAPQSKVIFCKQNAIFSVNLKMIKEDAKDGEVIDVPNKSLGSTELYPSSLKFSPNGRHFAILSDTEFVISTSGVYRNSCVGHCSDLAYLNSGDFVVKDGKFIKLYKEFTETASFKPGFSFDAVLGGPYIGIKTQDSVYIYDIESQTFIRKIDVSPNLIIWNENKTLLSLICEDATYVLKADVKQIEDYLDKNEGSTNEEEGCEDAFESINEINDKIMNGIFIDSIFVYLNNKGKLNYCINDKVFNITTLNPNFTLLGYLPSNNKIYLINKNNQLICYTFPLSFVRYQQEILQGNLKNAENIFDEIPEEYREKVTNFLEKFEYHEISYLITKSKAKKFILAIKLKKLSDAIELAEELRSDDKWKMVADLALELGSFKQAEKAMWEAKDYNALFLYYSCVYDRENIHKLANESERDGFLNIAYNCYFLINDRDKCLEILLKNQRYPEASLFCRTYFTSKLSEVLEFWNELINKEENTRLETKILNPLDNKEENEKVIDYEKICNDYYQHVEKDQNVGNAPTLLKFIDYDLDSHYDEHGNLDIDLNELLNL